MCEFAFQLNIINVASLYSNICNGCIVMVQLFAMIQWMWRKLMLLNFILFVCVNGVPTTCAYAHA